VWRTGDLWPYVLAVLAVYIYVTPWFLYWYLVGPLALIAVLPPSRFTLPGLTFSGTALISLAYPPAIGAEVAQTLLRYGPPAAVFVRTRRASGWVRFAPAVDSALDGDR
jgi:hypothetical protein